MKNLIKLSLGLIFIIIGITIFFLLDLGSEKYYILGAYLMAALIVLFILSKKTLPVMINLTSVKRKMFLNFLPIAAILLSIFVIPITYFVFSAISLFLSLAVSVCMQRNLAMDSRGIRYSVWWDLCWCDINNYILDEDNNILYINIKDGSQKQLGGIKPKYYHEIKENIDNYLVKNNK